MFYWKVVAILRSRGVKWDSNDFQVWENNDGKGPFIGIWNEEKLGLKPTQTEINGTVPALPLPKMEIALDAAINAATTLEELKSALSGNIVAKQIPRDEPI